MTCVFYIISQTNTSWHHLSTSLTRTHLLESLTKQRFAGTTSHCVQRNAWNHAKRSAIYDLQNSIENEPSKLWLTTKSFGSPKLNFLHKTTFYWREQAPGWTEWELVLRQSPTRNTFELDSPNSYSKDWRTGCGLVSAATWSFFGRSFLNEWHIKGATRTTNELPSFS